MRFDLLAPLLMVLIAGDAFARSIDPSRCAPDDEARAELLALAGQGAEPPDAQRRSALAPRLVDCLGHPDPRLRDGIAYAGLADWLRAGALAPDEIAAMDRRLLATLSTDPPDADGFARPFAALVLAEVARARSVADAAAKAGPGSGVGATEAGLPSDVGASQAGAAVDSGSADAARDRHVQAAADYLENVRDYRGFIDGEGWRHGVAHGADFAMQLLLDEALDRGQVERLVDAVLAQVAAGDGHAYVFGEPGRLARPLLFAMRRGLHDDEELAGWIARAADPGSLGSWDKAWESEAGLARRHNVMAFLMAMYVNLSAGSDERLRELLLPKVVEALRAMG